MQLLMAKLRALNKIRKGLLVLKHLVVLQNRYLKIESGALGVI